MDALLNWLWQGGVVAAATFVMLRALARARANVRYVVCWAALFAIVALPVLPSIHLAAPSIDVLSLAPADALVSLPDTWWTSAVVLVAAWSAWATVHVVRFVAAVLAIRRARARSVWFPSNEESRLVHWARHRTARRRATLVISEAVKSAAVLGWGTPLIALSPSLLDGLDAGEVDRVVIHEWAHVQRRDDLVNIVQVAVRAIAGWHPAVWWIDRRLQIEREIACDEMAVAITGAAKPYAECLMKLVSLGNGRRTLLTAPAVLSSSGLRARIVQIVSTRPSIAPLWSRSLAAAIVSIVCVLSLALAELRLVEAAVLALPIVSPRTLLTTGVQRVIAVHEAAPTLVSALKINPDRSTPTTDPATTTERHPLESPWPQPIVEPAPPVNTTDVSRATHAASPPPAIPDVADLGALATVPPSAPVGAAAATGDKSRALWAVAADGGTVIGKKSRDAGVATGGFFSRLAKRVAGSF